MTYILTSICRGYVLQTGDRLVTLRRTAEPWDPLANKSVLFRTRDAVVAASYAGSAYVRGTPADEWLASSLAGSSLARPDGFGSLSFGSTFDPGRDLGQSILALREDLACVPEVIDVTVAGFAWNRRERVRPVLWRISGHGGTAAHDRDVCRLGTTVVKTEAIGSGADALTPAIEKDIGEAVNVNGNEAHVAHVTAIRSAAAQQGQTRTVGEDCLSILIRRPPPLWAAVRFDPVLVDTHAAHLAFTPLIVTPYAVNYPSIFQGPGTFDGTGLHVVLEAPSPPPGRIRFFMESQRRRPAPS